MEVKYNIELHGRPDNLLDSEYISKNRLFLDSIKYELLRDTGVNSWYTETCNLNTLYESRLLNSPIDRGITQLKQFSFGDIDYNPNTYRYLHTPNGLIESFINIHSNDSESNDPFDDYVCPLYDRPILDFHGTLKYNPQFRECNKSYKPRYDIFGFIPYK